MWASSKNSFAEAEAEYKKGNFDKAIELFTKAAEGSDNPAIYGNRANCYSNIGNFEAAFKDYNTALTKAIEQTGNENDPNLSYFYYNRGFAYERAGEFERAIADYEKTIALNDDYPDVKNNLAWTLATCPKSELRNPQRAISIAREECEKSEWSRGTVVDTLAAAYVSAGEFSKAIEKQEEAIRLVDDAELKSEFSKRLALYRNDTPFFESETRD